jgi:AsmA protein
VGPLGGELGKGNIPLDIAIRAFKELTLTIKGTVSDVLVQPRFDLAIDLAPFSPRKLMGALGRTFPVSTSDPNALTKVALRARVKGSPSNVSLTDGIMDLDQSKITFSAGARDFNKPDVMLRMNMDEIDVDRYLPPAGKKESDTDKSASPPPPKKKTDLAALRKLWVDAEIRVGRVKVMGGRIQDALARIKGRDGMFRVDSLSLKAYQGSLAARADLDVRADRPKAGMNLEMKGVRVRPLLNDVLQKDFLEGTAQAKISLKFEGEDADAIKRTLNGEGNLSFTDGAIIGIDLPGMVRNVKEAFGGEKTTERPKTDFTELLVPFTIRDGLVHTSKTSLASPLLRAIAAGNAHLVQETLDMRVEAKLVATLKGQEDTKERQGLTIPVLVTGTFSSPRFTPDLEGILETEIRKRLKSPEVIIDIMRGRGASKENGKKTQEDTTKEILRGIFGK